MSVDFQIFHYHVSVHVHLKRHNRQRLVLGPDILLNVYILGK